MKILYEEAGDLIEIEFDATVSEKHEHSADVTVHPVEQFTDHVRALPVRLSVEAHVSNTPIKGAGGAAKQLRLKSTTSRLAVGALPYRNARYETQSNEVNANVLQFDEPEDRVSTVEEQLRKLMTEGTPFTAVTSMQAYEDMVISSISVPRDVHSNAATFSIAMQQIKVATTSTVDAPEPLEPRARRRGNAGAQSPVEEPRESALHMAGTRLADALGLGT